jgi:glycosyl-4,4'-diaponeurosporenoate acyltransferase
VALLGFYPALAADAGIWAAWSFAVGCWAARLPDSAVGRDGPVTRLRDWERDGLVYARFGIRRWKGRLPDFGGVLGGERKRLTDRRDPKAWSKMAAETRRGERTHWLILLALPVEAALRGGIILAPMCAYAAVANLPCIAAQRYNRGRLLALVARRRRREATRSSGRLGR